MWIRLEINQSEAYEIDKTVEFHLRHNNHRFQWAMEAEEDVVVEPVRQYSVLFPFRCRLLYFSSPNKKSRRNLLEYHEPR